METTTACIALFGPTAVFNCFLEGNEALKYFLLNHTRIWPHFDQCVAISAQHKSIVCSNSVAGTC